MNINREVLAGAADVQRRIMKGETIEQINASFSESNRQAMANMRRWFENLANDLHPITGEPLNKIEEGE